MKADSEASAVCAESFGNSADEIREDGDAATLESTKTVDCQRPTTPQRRQAARLQANERRANKGQAFFTFIHVSVYRVTERFEENRTCDLEASVEVRAVNVVHGHGYTSNYATRGGIGL